MDEIQTFYNKVKLEDTSDDPEGPAPITHVHVFKKAYPRMPATHLVTQPDPESQLDQLLGIRESSRIFSDKALQLTDLAKILGSCRIVDLARDPERRTYPSGGARFPVELYVVNFNVEGLEQGAFHYNMPDFCLERVLHEDLRHARRALISPYLENPAATLIFTSVLSRSAVKYGLRAYPYSLIEAGHMGQNIHLKCAELGIGSCSVSGFVDSVVVKTLDLTKGEIPIYSISIGHRMTHT
ncbi:MAG: SagB/ThcOx family dehydrogenase [Candidatus Woesearchaeota archaeon]